MKEPKTPPPPGMKWSLDAIGATTPSIYQSGHTMVLCSVPQTRAIRDAMEACVKAFDEDNEQHERGP